MSDNSISFTHPSTLSQWNAKLAHNQESTAHWVNHVQMQIRCAQGLREATLIPSIPHIPILHSSRMTSMPPSIIYRKCTGGWPQFDFAITSPYTSNTPRRIIIMTTHTRREVLGALKPPSRKWKTHNSTENKEKHTDRYTDRNRYVTPTHETFTIQTYTTSSTTAPTLTCRSQPQATNSP